MLRLARPFHQPSILFVRRATNTDKRSVIRPYTPHRPAGCWHLRLKVRPRETQCHANPARTTRRFSSERGISIREIHRVIPASVSSPFSFLLFAVSLLLFFSFLFFPSLQGDGGRGRSIVIERRRRGDDVGSRTRGSSVDRVKRTIAFQRNRK